MSNWEVFLYWVVIFSIVVLAIVVRRWMWKVEEWQDRHNRYLSDLEAMHAQNKQTLETLLTAFEKTKENLNTVAQLATMDHNFIETVKSTAKEATKASAARLASLQNRTMR